MKLWSKEHDALLNALRAGAIIPTLYRRLSLERFTPTDAEVRQLRDWAVALREDEAAWRIIDDALPHAAAWPEAWRRATAAGFGPRTDHHHALLFGEFTARFIAADDLESASWTWRECIAAWTRLFSSSYPQELFETVAPDLAREEPELLASILDPLVEARATELRSAVGLDSPRELPRLDRRRLRFSLRALAQLGAPQSADASPCLRRLEERAHEARVATDLAVLDRFAELGESVDLSEASGEALTGRFRWIADYYAIAQVTERAAVDVVNEAVETCWGLRRVGRDSIPEFDEILLATRSFNEELERRLLSFQSAFGHNGVCADFLVFLGERETVEEEKKALFRRGLQVCPGHRNSAMLLAWELVGDAQRVLVQLALFPALVARAGPPKRRARELVEHAWALCDEAASIYAFDEKLPEVRENVRKEAARLNVPLPDPDEPPVDADG